MLAKAFTFLIILICSSVLHAADEKALAVSPVMQDTSCPTCAAIPNSFQTNTEVGAGKSALTSTGEAAQRIINYLPNGDTKRGLQQYVDIVGADAYEGDNAVGTTNAGIAAFFSRKFSDPKNSCVRDAALSFYRDVEKYLKAKLPQDANCKPLPGNMIVAGKSVSTTDTATSCAEPDRAGLYATVGADRFKNLEPGWLWKLAMEHSKNDPNSAMFLIGMCGHDDTAQGEFSWDDNSPAALDEIREQCAELKKQKKLYDNEIKELSAHPDTNATQIAFAKSTSTVLNMQISQLQNTSSVQRQMNCPSAASGFYTPGSLGLKADIPKSVKDEIQRVQGDIGGAKKIPSKYYHVYGAAFMACQLVQNGISPSQAELIQTQAARLYRGIRMCGSNQEYLGDMKDYKSAMAPLILKYKINDPKQLTLAIVKDIRSGKIHCDVDNFDPQFANKLAKECAFLSRHSIPVQMITSDEFDMTDEQIANKVDNHMINGDAAELYNKWYIGGETVAGKTVPCTDIRVWGPADLTKPTESFFGNLSKPDDWGKDRYEKASQRLATWDVDFKWTEAQHSAGAKFAGQSCKKRSPNEPELGGICGTGSSQKFNNSSGGNPSSSGTTQQGVR
ncbi:hypothetical protein [Bdellovibrio sp. NC01]|uniref:hypothetical protein n=1 Tax=Bdellovibrio sp. NC01 TaxID=2220073 RepID=UPI0011589D57|nr:hypothetical protein [Bdellovibrio sp. NC01]